jgi:hypothetical protein
MSAPFSTTNVTEVGYFPTNAVRSQVSVFELNISDDSLCSLPLPPLQINTNMRKHIFWSGQSVYSLKNSDDGPPPVPYPCYMSPHELNTSRVTFIFIFHLICSDATISKLRKTDVNGVFTEQSHRHDRN